MMNVTSNAFMNDTPRPTRRGTRAASSGLARGLAGLGLVCGLMLASCGEVPPGATSRSGAPATAPAPQGATNAAGESNAAAAPAGEDKNDKAASSSIHKSDLLSAMNIQILKDKVVKPEDQWKQELTPEQFRILREKGTERAFTGKYWNTKDDGVYRCAGCNQPLFVSDTKFDSGCGWPSFFKPVAEGVITEHVDTSYGMTRTEVTCTRCGAHLGHVFEDAPHMPTGLRYCINSVSIDLQKKGEPAPEGAAPAQPAPETNTNK
jgi:peptide-methionine (R)-S-oxide reductase